MAYDLIHVRIARRTVTVLRKLEENLNKHMRARGTTTVSVDEQKHLELKWTIRQILTLRTTMKLYGDCSDALELVSDSQRRFTTAMHLVESINNLTEGDLTESANAIAQQLNSESIRSNMSKGSYGWKLAGVVTRKEIRMHWHVTRVADQMRLPHEMALSVFGKYRGQTNGIHCGIQRTLKESRWEELGPYLYGGLRDVQVHGLDVEITVHVERLNCALIDRYYAVTADIWDEPGNWLAVEQREQTVADWIRLTWRERNGHRTPRLNSSTSLRSC